MVEVWRARAREKARRMVVGREIEEWRHEVSSAWRCAMADLMETEIEVDVVDVGRGVSDWVIGGWRRVCWQR